MTNATSIIGFDTDQTVRLTGLNSGKLRYWATTGFFQPSIGHGRPGYAPIYSFKDVVALRTIARLREQAPLQELRRVGDWLAGRDDSWSSLRFWVVNKKVVFADPHTGEPVEAISGQEIIEIELAPIIDEVEEAIRKLSDRSDKVGKVSKRRRVSSNAARIAGTRVRTSAIWSFHQGGLSIEAILKEYPGLEARDVKAAIAYEQNEASTA